MSSGDGSGRGGGDGWERNALTITILTTTTVNGCASTAGLLGASHLVWKSHGVRDAHSGDHQSSKMSSRVDVARTQSCYMSI
jgi:hypothetical protein